MSAADREAAVDAIVRRARTVAGLAGEIVDALARAEAAEAEVARLRAIVESVRAARAASAAAATRYTAAWDAVGTLPPTAAQSEEIAAALRAAYEAGDALTAALDALDAAREGR